jgi:hypothetical protein
MISAGCLGSDGCGKAPLWRLTEKGNTSKQSPDGLREDPTKTMSEVSVVLTEGGLSRVASMCGRVAENRQ